MIYHGSFSCFSGLHIKNRWTELALQSQLRIGNASAVLLGVSLVLLGVGGYHQYIRGCSAKWKGALSTLRGYHTISVLEAVQYCVGIPSEL